MLELDESRLKVVAVTTWGTACGIATYSEELYGALDGAGVAPMILAPQEGGSCLSRRSTLPVEAGWTRGSDGIGHAILTHAKRYGARVLHVQHEFGLFLNNEAFYELLKQARMEKLATVVTLHTVHPYGDLWSGVLHNLRKLVDCIVVHTVQGFAVLHAVPGNNRVELIPHGSPYPQPAGSRNRGLERFHVPQRLRGHDVCWCLVFGFQGVGKNLICTLRAYTELRARGGGRNLGMIFCGQPDEYFSHLGGVPRLIGQTGFGATILERREFVPPADLPDLFALADFGILNTTGNHISASGQVHRYAAHGVPLAVADRPIYADAIRAGAVPFQLHVEPRHEEPTVSLVNAMSAFASSSKLRETVGASMEQLAKETAWSKVRETYVKLYRELVT